MNKRRKKAAYYAAIIYFSCAGLGCGMLKTAQQTRRTLYGGQPVMAQCTPALPDADADSNTYTMALGGGEWQISLCIPNLAEKTDALSEMLPPCTAKCVLRLTALAESLADQTAARLMSE